MARVTMVIDDCKLKVSAACSGTFSYERKGGRPPNSCESCRNFKPTKSERKASKLNRVTVTSSEPARPTEGKCGCGKTFAIASRGRPATRCEDCRAVGTVWRTDDDGTLQMIQASQISREEQDRRDAIGDARALALVERMKPLLEKKNRTVIVH